MSDLPAAPVEPAAISQTGRRTTRIVLISLGAMGALVLAIVFEILWTTIEKLTRVTANTEYYNLDTRGTSAQDILLFVALLLGFALPVVLFALIAFSQPRVDLGVGRFFDWPRLIVIAGEAGCIAMVVVLGLATRPPLWQPITDAALMVAFTVVAVVLAPRFVITVVALTELTLPAWNPRSTKSLAWAWWVVGGVIVVVAVAAVWLLHPWGTAYRGSDAARPMEGGLFSLAIGLQVGAFTCMVLYAVVLFRLNVKMIGPENGRGKTSRAIYLARNIQLTPVELEYARRVALMANTGAPWLIGFALLFGAGQFAEQLGFLTGKDNVGPALATFVGTVFAISAAVTIYLDTRARQFLARNGAPTPTNS